MLWTILLIICNLYNNVLWTIVKNLTVLLYEGGKRGKEGGQKEEGEGEKREYCNMNFVGYLANYS